LIDLRLCVPLDKTGHVGDIHSSQYLGIILKKLNKTTKANNTS